MRKIFKTGWLGIALILTACAPLTVQGGATDAALCPWARRDARQDTLSQIKEKDQDNAKEIRDRVSDSRTDPDRLRPFDGAGWRD